jgi:predicted transcriptional regulator
MPQIARVIPNQRLDDVVAILDTGLTATSIASPIASSAPQSDRKTREVRNYMKKNSFDRAAIAQSSSIVGYVNVNELDVFPGDDPIGLHSRPFEPDLLVSDGTPLPIVLQRMQNQTAIFVVGSDGINGIITPADLEKQCMRVYLFGLVSLLEQKLCRAMEELSFETVQSAIPDGPAQARFERDFHQKTMAGEELAPIYYTTLGTKRDLVLSAEKYWKPLGSTKRETAQKLSSVLSLRNALDHVNLLSGSISSWSSLCEAVQNVTGIIRDLETALTQGKAVSDASIGGR